MAWHGINCPGCGLLNCRCSYAPPPYQYDWTKELPKMFETINPALGLNQIAVDKTAATNFLEHKGWKCQRTSDNKDYWSKNGGQLMTLEAAFKILLESELPKTREASPNPPKKGS